MKRTIAVLGLVLTICVVGSTIDVYAGQPSPSGNPCSGLEGQARKNCLKKDQEYWKREAEKSAKKADRYDKALKYGCMMDKGAPAAAGAAAKGGGLAYKSGRVIGEKLTGTQPCK